MSEEDIFYKKWSLLPGYFIFKNFEFIDDYYQYAIFSCLLPYHMIFALQFFYRYCLYNKRFVVDPKNITCGENFPNDLMTVTIAKNLMGVSLPYNFETDETYSVNLEPILETEKIRYLLLAHLNPKPKNIDLRKEFAIIKTNLHCKINEITVKEMRSIDDPANFILWSSGLFSYEKSKKEFKVTITNQNSVFEDCKKTFNLFKEAIFEIEPQFSFDEKKELIQISWVKDKACLPIAGFIGLEYIFASFEEKKKLLLVENTTTQMIFKGEKKTTKIVFCEILKKLRKEWIFPSNNFKMIFDS